MLKRIIIAICVLALAISFVSAEEIKQFQYHSIFGITEESTEEETRKILKDVFDADSSSSGSNLLSVDNKFLYNLPVKYVYVEFNKDFQDNPYSKISIVFEDDTLTAENVYRLYSDICAELNTPDIRRVTSENITFKGKENVDIPLESTDMIQSAIDHNNLNGLICWGNVSLRFLSDAPITVLSDPSREMSIEIAYGEGGLSWDVKMLLMKNR